MEAQPLVSVVIPAYNAAKWIGVTLESVLAQTYPVDKLELLLVDDGSSDDTVAVARRALSTRQLEHRIVTVPNGGPGRARNLGWRQSRGTWVQFLDADDLLHPSKIEWQVNAVVAKGEDIAVAFSDWESMANATRGGPRSGARLGADPASELMAPENWIPTGSELYARAWLDRVGGYDEAMRWGEDTSLQVRLAMAGGRFVQVATPVPVFSYRLVEKSLSRKLSPGQWLGFLRFFESVESAWRVQEALTPSRALALAERYFVFARYYAESDRARFEELASRIEQLVPGFLPTAPRGLRVAARLVGYRRSELLSVHYRRWRTGLRRIGFLSAWRSA